MTVSSTGAPPTGVPEARPRWRVRAAVSLATLVGTLALAELGARLAAGEDFVPGELRSQRWKVCGRFDPRFGWSNRPGARAHIADGVVDYRVEINEAGFRDPERHLEAAPGVRRIALLGDSVSWGWGVDNGERFSDLLERDLGPDVEVLNFAVPGYGTDQQYWLFEEEVLSYHPDLVLVCFVLNDVFEASRVESYEMAKPRFELGASGQWVVENRPVPSPGFWRAVAIPAWRRLKAWSAFSVLLEDPLAGVEQREPGGNQFHRSRSSIEFMRDAVAKIHDEGSRTRMLLGLLRDRCAEEGIELAVFSVTHKHDQYVYEPDYPPPPKFDPERFRTHLSQVLAEIGREMAIEVLSVDRPMFARARAGERLHCGDGHLNERGNEVVAEALLPALRNRLSDLERPKRPR